MFWSLVRRKHLRVEENELAVEPQKPKPEIHPVLKLWAVGHRIWQPGVYWLKKKSLQLNYSGFYITVNNKPLQRAKTFQNPGDVSLKLKIHEV